MLADVCARFDKIVTIEDNVLQGGYGTAVLEYVSDNNCAVEVLRLGWPDVFIEQGARNLLLELYGLNDAGIVQAVRAFLDK